MWNIPPLLGWPRRPHKESKECVILNHCEGNTCGHEVMHLYVCWSSVPASTRSQYQGRSIWLHSDTILCWIWILWSTRCTYQIAECVLIVYVTCSLKCMFCNRIGAPSGSWKSDPGQKRCTSKARPSFPWVEGLTHQTACLLSKHSQVHTHSDLLINQEQSTHQLSPVEPLPLFNTNMAYYAAGVIRSQPTSLT